MSALWARATETRVGLDVSAPQPAEDRSLFTRASTSASAPVRPLVLGGVLGAGLVAGVVVGLVVRFGAGRRVGLGLVALRVGAGRTDGRVVPEFERCSPARCWVLRRLVPEVEGVLVLGAAVTA